MFRNVFIVAIRNFFRQRTQSTLNVSELAMGLACAIYVYRYAYDDLTYDTQHLDAGKITDSDVEELKNPGATPGWAL
jgi:putative ABC transport system permease protein